MPNYRSRRKFVSDLFRDLIQSVRKESIRPILSEPPAPQEATDLSNSVKWDVFVSHASEDKDDFVRPLAERLSELGLRVWFDEFTLAVGDSLRRSIDQGLSQSRYGVVVISPAFLRKHWPHVELNGMVAREVAGVKVILPVWHNIDVVEIRKHSPILADRLAVSSETGLENVASELLRAIRRDDEVSVRSGEERTTVTAPGIVPGTPKEVPAGELVALGPNIICAGEMLGYEQGMWSIRLHEFVLGDVGALIKFGEDFRRADPNDQYFAVNAIGDGRKLEGPPSLTRDGSAYVARCPVASRFPRIAAQDLPREFLLSSPNNDLVVEKGTLAMVSGAAALPQRILF